MPFNTSPITEMSLGSLEAVADWISDTQQSLKRISVSGVLEAGASFQDDEYFGDPDAFFHFNHPSFVALCHKLGCRQDLVGRLETPLLTSQVLNDLLGQRHVREALSDAEFVIDDRTKTIIGLVSKSYVTYSNQNFLEDVSARFRLLSNEEPFVFHEAYGINTALTIRFLAAHQHREISGRGGAGVDKTKIGLEFTNSMVGNASVAINYYLHRLVCANGMMVLAAKSVNRVFHSGRADSFEGRLDRSFGETVRSLDQLQQLLHSLGSLVFEPDTLSRNPLLTDQIFGVISGSKKELCDRQNLFLRYPPDASPVERERIRQAHDSQLIGLIPAHFGGEHSKGVFTTRLRDAATLFDFINVFTEYANTHGPARKLDIQERAGALAKYISANAKKF